MTIPRILWQSDTVEDTLIRSICIEKNQSIITLCNSAGQAIVDYGFETSEEMETWITKLATDYNKIRVIRESYI